MNTKALRQKILDLAIHGKLVPQDPNDEPASVLLERIKAEKEELMQVHHLGSAERVYHEWQGQGFLILHPQSISQFACWINQCRNIAIKDYLHYLQYALVPLLEGALSVNRSPCQV